MAYPPLQLFLLFIRQVVTDSSRPDIIDGLKQWPKYTVDHWTNGRKALWWWLLCTGPMLSFRYVIRGGCCIIYHGTFAIEPFGTWPRTCQYYGDVLSRDPSFIHVTRAYRIPRSAVLHCGLHNLYRKTSKAYVLIIWRPNFQDQGKSGASQSVLIYLNSDKLNYPKKLAWN